MDAKKKISDKLKIETRTDHQSLEKLPFFIALEEEYLPFESYVGFLRAMAVVHAVLELEASRSTDPVVAGTWREEMRRLSLIEKDLSFIESKEIEDIAEAARCSLELVANIRLWSRRQSVGLLGCLYVLEGSALGAQVLKPKIAKLFSLRTEGLSYLSSNGSETKARWEKFRQRMNAAKLTDGKRKTVVETAQKFFKGIASIVSALYPIDASTTENLVSTLNPEAGAHQVSHDPRELLAALDAGDTTWNAFPYFASRFGDRGKRFTQSDSAWLVTLSYLSQRMVHQEVEWLGRILASRGMPRFLLQKHLENLYDSLVKAVPERRNKYDKLLNAAKALESSRLHYMDERLFQTLSNEFENLVGPSWSKRMHGTGAILAAAVADEKAGLRDAVTSLEMWVTDSARFPEKWIEAVEVILRKARIQSAGPSAASANA